MTMCYHSLKIPIIVLGLSLSTAFARADAPESVEADVSARSVAITSSFSGTEIIVFGAVENSKQPSAEAGTYDVVVVVEGASKPVAVRKKSNVVGLWINTQTMLFASFPSYYAITSTRPIDEITDAGTRDKNEIGFDHVRMVPAGRSRTLFSDPEEVNAFREAAIRLKQRDRLYVTNDYGVTFIGRSLFRSTITLPPNVPVGPLTARVYLLREGKLLSQYESNVVLERTGVERLLYDSAFHRPWLYGLGTLLMAALAGLSAAFVFRRAVQ